MKKIYEKAEIIINEFASEEVILASSVVTSEYTKDEDDLELLPIV